MLELSSLEDPFLGLIKLDENGKVEPLFEIEQVLDKTDDDFKTVEDYYTVRLNNNSAYSNMLSVGSTSTDGKFILFYDIPSYKNSNGDLVEAETRVLSSDSSGLFKFDGKKIITNREHGFFKKGVDAYMTFDIKGIFFKKVNGRLFCKETSTPLSLAVEECDSDKGYAFLKRENSEYGRCAPFPKPVTENGFKDGWETPWRDIATEKQACLEHWQTPFQPAYTGAIRRKYKYKCDKEDARETSQKLGEFFCGIINGEDPNLYDTPEDPLLPVTASCTNGFSEEVSTPSP